MWDRFSTNLYGDVLNGQRQLDASVRLNLNV